MNRLELSEPFNYEHDRNFAKIDKVSFFDKVAKKYIKWDKIYDQAYSGDEDKPDWYKGGKLNLCYNILDLKAEDPKFKDQIAVIHECPTKKVCSKITYNQLWTQVCIFSRALKNLGIKKGDRVLINMPNCIEVVIAIYSCIRLGAIHCNIFSGLSSVILASRIDHCKPKLLIISNCGIKNNDLVYYSPEISKSLELITHKLENVIELNRVDIKSEEPLFKIKNSLYWNELIKGLEPLLDYEIIDSHDPLYLAYTSGTTGQPKGLLSLTGPHGVMLNYLARSVYNLKAGDVFFSTSDIGWLIGQNVGTYITLMSGATSIFIEGDTCFPNANIFFKIIETHKAKGILTCPTEIKMIRKGDPDGSSISNLDLSSLEYIMNVGERLDESVVDYLISNVSKNYNIKVTDNYGLSEVGTCISYAHPLFQFPFKPKSAGKALPGFNITILNHETGEIVKPYENGEIVIKLPLPPSCVNTLFLNPTGFDSNYLNRYPGYFRTGDLGYFDSEDYFFIISRVDDVASVYGEKIYCGLIEEVIQNNHTEEVLDSVVVGIKDEIYGERVIALVIFKSPNDLNIESFKNTINKQLEETINNLSRLKYVIPVSAIPRTTNGKKIRSILSKIYNNEEYQTHASIKNIEDLKQIEFEINQFKSNNNSSTEDYNLMVINE